MCGICGFANYKDDALLRRMTGALIHRGPDDEGFYTDGDRASLGMRRLKIIDLATGAQPMFNEDGRVAVVFNGEIYNFKELRAELEGKGHRFRSRSDTEVLVHLYEEHGAELASRLRGMFAFAVWDSRAATLLLARDQFGVKPLYYALHKGRLFFSSEIKSLPLGGLIPDELSPEAIDAYFARMCVPAPLSIYRHVRKLEPAQTLEFRAGQAKIRTYWRLPPPGTSRLKEPELLEKIDALLAASVTEQLVSDVPLGLLLSSGLDSSSILYYMSRASSAPPRTFTVGYGPADPSYDESAAASRLASAFKAEHTVLKLDPDVKEMFGKLALQFDEPFADSSAIPTYLVTAEARRHAAVALTGVGGDELFGGYPRYLGARLLPAYLKLPAFIRQGLGRAAAGLPEGASSSNTSGRIKRFLKGGAGDFSSAYGAWATLFDYAERRRLYSEGFSAALVSRASQERGAAFGPDDIYASELRNYLSDDLLCLADRTSMANSLELRVPFLDVRLAELMAGVPLSLKTKGFRLKYLLKKLMTGRLPPEILRGSKRGFQVPLARWFREDLRELVHDTLCSPSGGSGCLSREYLARLVAEHESGRRNISDGLHAALTFELWMAARPRAEGGGFNPGIGARSGSLTIVAASDIIPYDDEGGSGRVAWETARRLAARGHKVIMFTRGARGRKPAETVDGIEIWRYGSNPLSFRTAAAGVLNRYGKPDALELHHPFSGGLALKFFSGVPALYHFHSPWSEEYEIRAADLGRSALRTAAGSAARRLAERYALTSSKIILNASRFMAGRMTAMHGLSSKIVPLGVDTARFSPAADPAALRRRLNLPKGRFVILTIRNLVSRMGLENLVEAASEVVKKEPGALFIIGGRGYLRQKLEEMIVSRGLSGHVRLEGFIPESELALYYKAADLFVLPTRLLEGFGLVTLEAMACGTPVLATPVAANVELLGAFSEEFLLAGESPAAIAQGINRFISVYSGRAEELRVSCRAFVEMNYSWDKYAAAVEKELFRMTDGR